MVQRKYPTWNADAKEAHKKMLGDEELDDLDKVISANLLTYRGNHSDETIAECYVLAKLCEEAAKARPQQRAGSKRGTSPGPPTIGEGGTADSECDDSNSGSEGDTAETSVQGRPVKKARNTAQHPKVTVPKHRKGTATTPAKRPSRAADYETGVLHSFDKGILQGIQKLVCSWRMVGGREWHEANIVDTENAEVMFLEAMQNFATQKQVDDFVALRATAPPTERSRFIYSRIHEVVR